MTPLTATKEKTYYSRQQRLAAHQRLQTPPNTKLGELAHALALASNASVITITALSGYVYALTQAQLPVVTFSDTPGPGIDSKKLQDAYDAFKSQFAGFQGQARGWISTDSGGAPSILSQLSSIPQSFSIIAGSVASDLATLQATEPGSDSYEQALAQLEKLVNAQVARINGLNQSMDTLGTDLQNAATVIVTAATSGVLKDLYDAYEDEIKDLEKDIKKCQDTISSDNGKMIADGFAIGGAALLGLVGIVNLWNPVGYYMLGAGIWGLYAAIEEMNKLKGDIADQKAKIQNDEIWQQADTAGAASVSSFANQVQGFSSVNTDAQDELTTLENLFSTLADDIAAMVKDLDDADLDEAQSEWAEIVNAAQVLSDVTAYIWPTSMNLSSPTSFSVTGSDVYAVDISGAVYLLKDGKSSWKTLADSALSCVASDSAVIAIDGQPINGTEVNPNPSTSSFYVKKYKSDDDKWESLSDFAVAEIATDGSDIYAIKQDVSDRQVYKYKGSGLDWKKLTDLPGPDKDTPDAAGQLAVADGKLFVIAHNSQLLYRYDSDKWKQVGDFTCASINGNGKKLAILATSLDAYLYDAKSGDDPVKTKDDVSRIVQLSSGDQLAIKTDLHLYFIDNQSTPSSSTKLKSNATGVFVSDSDIAYYTDNQGAMWVQKDSDPSKNKWTELPDFTDGSS